MIQVSSRPPGDPVCCEMVDATMKMPDPIIEPTTIIVPSNKPMARTKPCSLAALPDEIAWVLSAICRFLMIFPADIVFRRPPCGSRPPTLPNTDALVLPGRAREEYH